MYQKKGKSRPAGFFQTPRILVTEKVSRREEAILGTRDRDVKPCGKKGRGRSVLCNFHGRTTMGGVKAANCNGESQKGKRKHLSSTRCVEILGELWLAMSWPPPHPAQDPLFQLSPVASLNGWLRQTGDRRGLLRESCKTPRRKRSAAQQKWGGGQKFHNVESPSGGLLPLTQRSNKTTVCDGQAVEPLMGRGDVEKVMPCPFGSKSPDLSVQELASTNREHENARGDEKKNDGPRTGLTPGALGGGRGSQKSKILGRDDAPTDRVSSWGSNNHFRKRERSRQKGPWGRFSS